MRIIGELRFRYLIFRLLEELNQLIYRIGKSSLKIEGFEYKHIKYKYFSRFKYTVFMRIPECIYVNEV